MTAFAQDSSHLISSALQNIYVYIEREREKRGPLPGALCSQQLVLTVWELTLNNFIAGARSLSFTICALPIFMETRISICGLLLVQAAGERQLGPRHFVGILASEQGLLGLFIFRDFTLWSDGLALPLNSADPDL